MNPAVVSLASIKVILGEESNDLGLDSEAALLHDLRIPIPSELFESNHNEFPNLATVIPDLSLLTLDDVVGAVKDPPVDLPVDGGEFTATPLAPTITNVDDCSPITTTPQETQVISLSKSITVEGRELGRLQRAARSVVHCVLCVVWEGFALTLEAWKGLQVWR